MHIVRGLGRALSGRGFRVEEDRDSEVPARQGPETTGVPPGDAPKGHAEADEDAEDWAVEAEVWACPTNAEGLQEGLRSLARHRAQVLARHREESQRRRGKDPLQPPSLPAAILDLQGSRVRLTSLVLREPRVIVTNGEIVTERGVRVCADRVLLSRVRLVASAPHATCLLVADGEAEAEAEAEIDVEAEAGVEGQGDEDPGGPVTGRASDPGARRSADGAATLASAAEGAGAGGEVPVASPSAPPTPTGAAAGAGPGSRPPRPPLARSETLSAAGADARGSALAWERPPLARSRTDGSLRMAVAGAVGTQSHAEGHAAPSLQSAQSAAGSARGVVAPSLQLGRRGPPSVAESLLTRSRGDGTLTQTQGQTRGMAPIREEGASGSRTLPLSTRVRASLDACVLSAPNGHGLEVVGAGATCALSKCTVEQCRGEGLRAAEGGRASFTKGAVMGSKKGPAVVVSGTGSALALEGTLVTESRGPCVVAEDGGRLDASACRVSRSREGAVVVAGADTQAALVQCQVSDCLGVGVGVSEGAIADLEGCEVFGCQEGGLRAEGPGSVALLSACRVHSFQGSAVVALGGAEVASLGSVVYGSQDGALVVVQGPSSRASLERCDLFGAASDCLTCTDGACLSVGACRVLASARGCVVTVEGADSTAEVDACTLSGCKGPVVFVGDQATAAVVNSHLTGSATSHGVMAEGAGTAVQVSDCLLRSFPTCALLSTAGAQLTARGCTLLAPSRAPPNPKGLTPTPATATATPAARPRAARAAPRRRSTSARDLLARGPSVASFAASASVASPDSGVDGRAASPGAIGSTASPRQPGSVAGSAGPPFAPRTWSRRALLSPAAAAGAPGMWGVGSPGSEGGARTVRGALEAYAAQRPLPSPGDTDGNETDAVPGSSRGSEPRSPFAPIAPRAKQSPRRQASTTAMAMAMAVGAGSAGAGAGGVAGDGSLALTDSGDEDEAGPLTQSPVRVRLGGAGVAVDAETLRSHHTHALRASARAARSATRTLSNPTSAASASPRGSLAASLVRSVEAATLASLAALGLVAVRGQGGAGEAGGVADLVPTNAACVRGAGSLMEIAECMVHPGSGDVVVAEVGGELQVLACTLLGPGSPLSPAPPSTALVCVTGPASFARVHACEGTSFGSIGVAAKAGGRVDVAECSLEGSGLGAAGVHASGAHAITTAHSSTSHHPISARVAEESPRGSPAPGLRRPAATAVVTGCRLRSFRRGVRAVAGAEALVQGSEVSGTGVGWGMVADGPRTRVQAEGCEVKGAVEEGVRCAGGARVSLAACEVTQCGAAGVASTGLGSSVVARDCGVVGCGGTGVACRAGGAFAAEGGVRIESTERGPGVVAEGGTARLAGTTVQGCAGGGVEARGGGAVSLDAACAVRECEGAPGVAARGKGSHVAVRGAAVAGCGAGGVWAEAGGRVEVEGASVEGCGAGAGARGGHVSLQGCTVAGCAPWAVCAGVAGRVAAADCALKGAGAAARGRGAAVSLQGCTVTGAAGPCLAAAAGGVAAAGGCQVLGSRGAALVCAEGEGSAVGLRGCEMSKGAKGVARAMGGGQVSLGECTVTHAGAGAALSAEGVGKQGQAEAPPRQSEIGLSNCEVDCEGAPAVGCVSGGRVRAVGCVVRVRLTGGGEGAVAASGGARGAPAELRLRDCEVAVEGAALAVSVARGAHARLQGCTVRASMMVNGMGPDSLTNGAAVVATGSGTRFAWARGSLSCGTSRALIARDNTDVKVEGVAVEVAVGVPDSVRDVKDGGVGEERAWGDAAVEVCGATVTLVGVTVGGHEAQVAWGVVARDLGMAVLEGGEVAGVRMGCLAAMGGAGLVVRGGAKLHVPSADNGASLRGWGVVAEGEGTRAVVTGCEVVGEGEGGVGLEAREGGTVRAVDCVVAGMAALVRAGARARAAAVRCRLEGGGAGAVSAKGEGATVQVISSQFIDCPAPLLVATHGAHASIEETTIDLSPLSNTHALLPHAAHLQSPPPTHREGHTQSGEGHTQSGEGHIQSGEVHTLAGQAPPSSPPVRLPPLLPPPVLATHSATLALIRSAVQAPASVAATDASPAVTGSSALGQSPSPSQPHPRPSVQHQDVQRDVVGGHTSPVFLAAVLAAGSEVAVAGGSVGCGGSLCGMALVGGASGTLTRASLHPGRGESTAVAAWGAEAAACEGQGGAAVLERALGWAESAWVDGVPLGVPEWLTAWQRDDNDVAREEGVRSGSAEVSVNVTECSGVGGAGAGAGAGAGVGEPSSRHGPAVVRAWGASRMRLTRLKCRGALGCGVAVSGRSVEGSGSESQGTIGPLTQRPAGVNVANPATSLIGSAFEKPGLGRDGVSTAADGAGSAGVGAVRHPRAKTASPGSQGSSPGEKSAAALAEELAAWAGATLSECTVDGAAIGVWVAGAGAAVALQGCRVGAGPANARCVAVGPGAAATLSDCALSGRADGSGSASCVGVQVHGPGASASLSVCSVEGCAEAGRATDGARLSIATSLLECLATHTTDATPRACVSVDCASLEMTDTRVQGAWDERAGTPAPATVAGVSITGAGASLVMTGCSLLAIPAHALLIQGPGLSSAALATASGLMSVDGPVAASDVEALAAVSDAGPVFLAHEPGLARAAAEGSRARGEAAGVAAEVSRTTVAGCGGGVVLAGVAALLREVGVARVAQGPGVRVCRGATALMVRGSVAGVRRGDGVWVGAEEELAGAGGVAATTAVATEGSQSATGDAEGGARAPFGAWMLRRTDSLVSSARTGMAAVVAGHEGGPGEAAVAVASVAVLREVGVGECGGAVVRVGGGGRVALWRCRLSQSIGGVAMDARGGGGARAVAVADGCAVVHVDEPHVLAKGPRSLAVFVRGGGVAAVAARDGAVVGVDDSTARAEEAGGGRVVTLPAPQRAGQGMGVAMGQGVGQGAGQGMRVGAGSPPGEDRVPSKLPSMTRNPSTKGDVTAMGPTKQGMQLLPPRGVQKGDSREAPDVVSHKDGHEVTFTPRHGDASMAILLDMNPGDASKPNSGLMSSTSPAEPSWVLGDGDELRHEGGVVVPPALGGGEVLGLGQSLLTPLSSPSPSLGVPFANGDHSHAAGMWAAETRGGTTTVDGEGAAEGAESEYGELESPPFAARFAGVRGPGKGVGGVVRGVDGQGARDGSRRGADGSTGLAAAEVGATMQEAPPGQPAPALTTAPMINLQATRGPMATSESPTAVDGEAVGLDTPRGAVLAETHSAESAGSAGSALGSVDGGAGVRAEVRAGASPGVVKGDETPPEAGMSPGGSTASWLMSTPSRVWRRVLSAVTPRRAANPDDDDEDDAVRVPSRERRGDRPRSLDARGTAVGAEGASSMGAGTEGLRDSQGGLSELRDSPAVTATAPLDGDGGTTSFDGAAVGPGEARGADVAAFPALTVRVPSQGQSGALVAADGRVPMGAGYGVEGCDPDTPATGRESQGVGRAQSDSLTPGGDAEGAGSDGIGLDTLSAELDRLVRRQLFLASDREAAGSGEGLAAMGREDEA